jgi:hypothetical protein
MLRWFLVSGEGYGVLIMVMGLLLSVWALVNLVAVRSRPVVLVQVFLSFLPLLVCLLAVSDATQDFMTMARSERAPKPSELAQAVSLGLVCGILGPLATLVPSLLGLVKLSLLSREAQRDAPHQA